MKRGSAVGTGLLAAACLAALGVAMAPAANATQEHLSICHSGSGANWTFIEPAAPGYNGHQHHDADIYGLTEAECLGKNVIVPPPPPEPKSVALYLYNKLNDAAPAAWENSGLQTLHSTKDGDTWFTSIQTVPVTVCGPGWAYQQDKAYKTADSWPTNIEYPTDNIGWPPIYDAKHGELSELIAVPNCPPSDEPPVDEPPVDEPPVTNPPVDEPPATNPPGVPLLAETAARVSPVAVVFGIAAVLLGGVAVWATSRYAKRVKDGK